MSLLISASCKTCSQDIVNRYAISNPLTSRILVLNRFNWWETNALIEERISNVKSPYAK
jgi:hypothetical protein